MTSTIDYYGEHADAFREDTESLDLGHLYDVFLKLLPDGGRVLDAGCGTGRDALEFRNRGYDVLAFDASERMVAIAGQRTGQPVQTLTFKEVEFDREFDGIWACASLLHVPRSDLADAVARLVHSLKTRGVLYMSFKYGEGEQFRGGRHFTNMTEASVERLVAETAGAHLLKTWLTCDVRPDRGSERWLNVLVQRDQDSG